MVPRDDVVSFLNQFLGVAGIRDYGPQGLQVEGRPTVGRVVTGVSCSLELFERAAERAADLVLVHHGLLWDRDPRQVTGVFRGRLKFLLEHELNLVAYHLPLDAHPEVGHSACIARQLGLVDRAPFGVYQGVTLGARGRFESPLTVAALTRRLEDLFGQEPFVVAAGAAEVRTVAVVSGGAADMAAEAAAAGVDCYVTGEAREGTPAFCREVGLNFAAVGHYNSEKPGLLALGELLIERFGLAVEFVDVPNPL